MLPLPRHGITEASRLFRASSQPENPAVEEPAIDPGLFSESPDLVAVEFSSGNPELKEWRVLAAVDLRGQQAGRCAPSFAGPVGGIEDQNRPARSRQFPRACGAGSASTNDDNVLSIRHLG